MVFFIIILRSVVLSWFFFTTKIVVRPVDNWRWEQPNNDYRFDVNSQELTSFSVVVKHTNEYFFVFKGRIQGVADRTNVFDRKKKRESQQKKAIKWYTSEYYRRSFLYFSLTHKTFIPANYSIIFIRPKNGR